MAQVVAQAVAAPLWLRLLIQDQAQLSKWITKQSHTKRWGGGRGEAVAIWLQAVNYIWSVMKFVFCLLAGLYDDIEADKII